MCSICASTSTRFNFFLRAVGIVGMVCPLRYVVFAVSALVALVAVVWSLNDEEDKDEGDPKPKDVTFCAILLLARRFIFVFRQIRPFWKRGWDFFNGRSTAFSFNLKNHLKSCILAVTDISTIFTRSVGGGRRE